MNIPVILYSAARDILVESSAGDPPFVVPLAWGQHFMIHKEYILLRSAFNDSSVPVTNQEVPEQQVNQSRLSIA